jgi:hypothetical protein
MKQLDAMDIFNTVMGGIMSRLHIDYPDVYERYLKRWHPTEYEAYQRSKSAQAGQSLQNSHAGYACREHAAWLGISIWWVAIVSVVVSYY